MHFHRQPRQLFPLSYLVPYSLSSSGKEFRLVYLGWALLRAQPILCILSVFKVHTQKLVEAFEKCIWAIRCLDSSHHLLHGWSCGVLLFLGMWELPLCCACTFKKKFIPPLEGSGKEPTDIPAHSLPHLLTSYCPFWKGVTLGIFFLDKLLPLTPLEAIFCVLCCVL